MMTSKESFLDLQSISVEDDATLRAKYVAGGVLKLYLGWKNREFHLLGESETVFVNEKMVTRCFCVGSSKHVKTKSSSCVFSYYGTTWTVSLVDR